MKLAIVIAAIVMALLVMSFGARQRREPQPQAPATDADVIEQLRLAGSDLSKPHNVEFFLYFPTEANANRIATQIAQAGYTTEVSLGKGTSHYLLFATRALIPTDAELTRIRNEFETLAKTEGGVYDGWGSPIVK